jgi:membrane protease YdiL (CAAX protease family)
MEQASSPASSAPPAIEPTPDWRPWFGFAAFFGALVCTLVAFAIIAGFLGIEDSDDAPTLLIVVTLLQNGFLLGAALLFARSVTPPRPWHFGLRRAALWSTVGWAALGMLAFYVLTAVYAVLVDPSAEQDVTDSLGADDGTLGLIAAGVMVMVVAPFAEETFFRGFFYRALRTRYSVLVGAAVNGLVFGAIHYGFDGADGLLILPPLAFLGAIFCLVYEKTGTLWATIGLHALNNAIAFSAQTKDNDGWQVAVVVGPLMLIACVVIPKLMRDGPAALPPPAGRARPEARLSLPVE